MLLAGWVPPTSQQWEKAARGLRGDIYPWGAQLTPAKCNVRESEIRHTTPVDRVGARNSAVGADLGFGVPVLSLFMALQLLI